MNPAPILMTILRSGRFQYRRSQTYLAAIILSFGLSFACWAVSPPPVGGYPNENIALGTDALFSSTPGNMITALGFEAL